MTGGVAFLRRRTLARSARSYVRWVGRAVGWWTVVYLVFWLVAFVASGVQTVVVPAAEPLPSAVAALASAALAVWLALPLLGGRVPPAHLDRRDLLRPALAPERPRSVLAYRLGLKRGAAAVGGATAGGLWSLFAGSFLHVPAPWAAAALAALAVARFDLRWLRYAGRAEVAGEGLTARRVGSALALVAALSAAAPLVSSLAFTGGLAAAGASGWSLAVTSALVAESPVTLLAPVALMACAWLAVRRSLAERWPPRFAAQSFVLSQLGGLRSLQMLAQMAGLDLGAQADPGERERLLATLHDRPGSLRPARSLPRPPVEAPAWVALAWRGASTLVRRPARQLPWLLARALAAGVAGLFAVGPLVSGAGSPTQAQAAVGLALGGALGGAVAVLFAGFLIAQAVAALLGPAPPPRLAPLTAGQRTWGRLAPALGVLAVTSALGAALVGLVLGPGQVGGGATALVAFVALALTTALALEKYSSWSGASPRRFEPQAVAAIVVALPALVLEALGYPEWVLMGELVLLVVAVLVDV